MVSFVSVIRVTSFSAHFADTYFDARQNSKVGLNAELHARERQAYFDQVDVFPSRVAFTAVFAHDHSEPRDQRTSATSAGEIRYNLAWVVEEDG
jgi:hypothetical protein